MKLRLMMKMNILLYGRQDLYKFRHYNHYYHIDPQWNATDNSIIIMQVLVMDGVRQTSPYQRDKMGVTNSSGSSRPIEPIVQGAPKKTIPKVCLIYIIN